MRSISLNAYGKINFALDVVDKLPNGYHKVDMIMHLIELHDKVKVRWYEGGDDFTIQLHTNKYYLPTDSRNIAYMAAKKMQEIYAPDIKGTVKIDIRKDIPVAAGLAGGSGNGAAVVLALNYLWNLDLSLEELCQVGAMLGSDVPFSMVGQAKVNKKLGEKLNNDPLATVCARALGTGTELVPLPSIKSLVLITKPSICVSTAEVYKGLDYKNIERHPNMDEMVSAIKKRQQGIIRKNMINVLEEYTANAYPQVKKTILELLKYVKNGQVLMSGSGPTVFSVFIDENELESQFEGMLRVNKETIKTRTIV